MWLLVSIDKFNIIDDVKILKIKSILKIQSGLENSFKNQ